MTRFTLTSILFLSLLSACAPKANPDFNQQVDQAVAGTLSSIPTGTLVPIPTPYPTSTPLDLNGLYCEYQFCIGHPAGMAFYDHLASLNPQTPSRYDNGFLVAYQIPAMVIHLIWLQAPGTADPGFLLDTLLDIKVDTRSGNLDVKLVRGMNVIYTPITTAISPDVPFGGAGAWTCGERVFAWKAYTPNADTAGPLFEEALARFMCT
jgi:hypothetical protein